MAPSQSTTRFAWWRRARAWPFAALLLVLVVFSWTRRPSAPPVSTENLHAMLYCAMGISPKQSYEIEQRPFYVTKDGLGEPIMELLA